MSSPMLPELVIPDEDSLNFVSTPTLTQIFASFGPPASNGVDASPAFEHPKTEAASAFLSPNSSSRRLPVPTPSADHSQVSFTFVNVDEENGTGSFDGLPSEVASADISIAPDGSFIETSSGQAAHELKKRYDRIMGVSKENPSPFAITAFTNQHGRQMFRVGHRELKAPARTAEQVEEEIERRATLHVESGTYRSYDHRRATHSVSERRTTRRSRLSMNAFLPPGMFPVTISRSPERFPSPHHTKDGARSPPTRKLRKTRSNPLLPHQSQTPDIAADPHASYSGRGHSQSVTAADLPRFQPSVTSVAVKPLERGDIFSDVMQLQNVPSSPMSSSSASLSSRSRSTSDACDDPSAPAVIANPFGARVTFDSPSRPAIAHLNPPVIREMQSFESGMTARPDPVHVCPTATSDTVSLRKSSPAPSDTLPSNLSSSFLPRPGSIDRSYIPTMETLMYTQYSTEVFDVLQTYSGLPLLDRLLPDSTETTVIKMSSSADEFVTPRDDPRFVLWGQAYTDRPEDSRTDRSSSRSRASRRRSAKGRDSAPDDYSSADSSDHGAAFEKILLAATIERWLAQLTSELNYDELLVFFMTYRSYIGPVDLCHLLICRFHWSLGQHMSEHDERVRRIVRVRTFVAMRYWLLTFFEVDFIPNRELRLLIAGWLNALKKDPILQKHHDAPGIVRKLTSVVRECKEAHSLRVHPIGSPASRQTNLPAVKSATNSPPKKKHPLVELFGKSFEGVSSSSGLAFNDSDLDLDFVPEGQHGEGDFHVNGHSDTLVGGDSVLQQPLHRAIMEHRPSISAVPALHLPVTPTTLPMHQNILSRAFINTIGRLGRWKRVNSRPAAVNPHPGALTVCGDMSAFDLDLNVTDDLLTVRGGVEQYLRMIEAETQGQGQLTPSSFPPKPAVPTIAPIPVITPPPPVPPPAELVPPESTIPPASERSSLIESAPDVPNTAAAAAPIAADAVIPDDVLSTKDAKTANATPPSSSGVASPDHLSLQSSLRTPSRGSSSSSSSYGNNFTSRFPHSSTSSRGNPWGVDVVSIDDLDLSDDSDGADENAPSGPPGLRKPGPRRLPLRRDFEFVGRQRESVSSLGVTSAHDSVSSAATSSVHSGGLGRTIQQWQVDALVDSLSDDDEAGDVEDALKRLEGHLNPQKQREKESKVDNWVKTIRDRLEAGDYGLPTDRSHRNTDGDDSGRHSAAWSVGSDLMRPDTGSSARSSVASMKRIVPEPWSVRAEEGESTTPVIAHAPGSTNFPSSPPTVDPAVPDEILRSRLSPSLSPPQMHSPLQSAASSTIAVSHPTSRFTSSHHPPQLYRSWVLNHSSSELAEHFTMIDKELFLAIKFEELIGDEWIRAGGETNVLDWGAFLKERARWKAERRSGYKTSALATARARFNLVACFVLSEIVLTPPSARHLLVGKFIRVAWKCYSINNYSTLVAIIAGLRSDWVQRVMRKHWRAVSVYNLRILNDLTSFVSREDDFAHMRNAVRTFEDYKHGANEESSSAKGSSVKNTKENGPPICVPFIGIYLSQLQRYHQLPDLIDPTAPREAVGIDRNTNSFQAPAHPEVFAALMPLPPSMQLEPLINIHKQRLMAGTIKSLVAGQHLASRAAHPVDKKLFQRCLKLRGLDQETLQRAAKMYPNS